MFYDSKFMKVQEMIHRELGALSLRRKVIADNIANVDVPHFKRSEVNFESELKRAIESGKKPRYELYLTNKKHIPLFEPTDWRSVKPRIHLDYTTSYRNDGNNVDIEKEMVDNAKTTLRYVALIERYTENSKLLLSLMNSNV